MIPNTSRNSSCTNIMIIIIIILLNVAATEKHDYIFFAVV